MILALVLGVAAGGASYAYLHSVQQRAYHNAQLIDVYVAKGTIPKGASGAQALSAGLIVKAQIPTEFRPASAVTDLATISSEVAQATITNGQVVSSSLFAAPVAQTGGAAASAIPAGDVAITISVDTVHEVAGLVQPGDQVDLLVQRNDGSEYVLYQDVPVLAIGASVAQPATAASVPAAAAASNLVTFAVPLDAATRLAMVESGTGGVSNIYMVLVPPNSHPSSFRSLAPRDVIPTGPTPQ
ncbi:MAG: Flp pilus assembly protein CpaB [Acidimicrobiales bacterium]